MGECLGGAFWFESVYAFAHAVCVKVFTWAHEGSHLSQLHPIDLDIVDLQNSREELGKKLALSRQQRDARRTLASVSAFHTMGMLAVFVDVGCAG